MELIREFMRAGLQLELPAAPLADANRDIFQMDIRRHRGAEWFRLWRGHGENVVRIADADRARRQLVLLVQEARRTFVERVSRRFVREDRLTALLSRGEARILRRTPDEIVIQRATIGSMRRFLAGTDERHLFIAQFDGGTTVRDAHRLLKPGAVREVERSHAGRTLRQGEWFFVALTAVERSVLRRSLEASPWLVRRFQSLGGNGRPHVAAEVIRGDDGRTYARGAVRHPDHKTLVLDDWRRVHRNAEVRQESLGRNGIYWVD